MAIKPVLQALILADQIYVDRRTGKNVIAGTFRRLWARDFPTKYRTTTWAFVSLTDIQGSAQIHLRYTNLRTNEVLLGTKPMTVTCDDPLQSVELFVEVPPFPMPHPGVYAFELYVGEELLGSLRISVAQIKGEVPK